MKKITSKIISVLCAVCMLIPIMSTAVFADGKPDVTINIDRNKKNADIELNNVGGYVYSVQLTLQANTRDTEFSVRDNDRGVYSVVKNENNKIVLYVDFYELVDGSKKIDLATISADADIQISGKANLIVVNRSMRATEYSNINVTVNEPSNNSSSGSSGSSGGNSDRDGGEIARPIQNQNQTGLPSLPPNNTSNTGFEDVPADFWASSSIKFVTDKGLFAGMSDTTFEPHSQMTRGMYVTVLSRFGEKLGEEWKIPCDTPAAFNDIAGDEWFADAVSWAGGIGLVNGIDDGVFGAYYPITREQIAVMTMNYAKLCQKTPQPREEAVTFTDADSINDWAKESVTLAQCAGLIYGREDGTFAPQATATRAEVAAILSRFIQNVN